MINPGSIRGIKTPIGLQSRTYAEALFEIKIFYDKARNDEIKTTIAATLFLVYQRESCAVVRADIERGTP